MPFRLSNIGWPVAVIAFSNFPYSSVGRCCFNIANAPATWGAAIDVPKPFAYSARGMEEFMYLPGANKVRKEALLEKLEIWNCVVPLLPSSIEPTLTLEEIHAGALIVLEEPSFPEQATLGILAERRLFIAAVNAGYRESQNEVEPLKTILIFTAAILKSFRKAKTLSSPLTRSDSNTLAHGALPLHEVVEVAW
jgi:hypothetical protein